MKTTSSSWDDIYKHLNKQSGLFGLSGAGDMRVVKEKALKGDANCHLTREVYAERCRKYLGSYYVKLGGNVDAVVFCGGIGEGDTSMRQLILSGLQDLQISVDSTRNQIASKGVLEEKCIMKIHTPFSKTKVIVVPTDEEVSIALQSSKLLLSQTMDQQTLDVEQDKKVDTTTEALRTGSGLMKKVVKSNLFCHSLGGTYTCPEEVGLLNVIAASVEKVGYFYPAGHRGSNDYCIQLMKQHFNFGEQELEMMYGVDESVACDLLVNNKKDELYE